jgi:hypothetical protein
MEGLGTKGTPLASDGFLAVLLKCKANLSVDRYTSVLDASQQTLFRARQHQRYQTYGLFSYIALMLFSPSPHASHTTQAPGTNHFPSYTIMHFP